MAGPPSLLRAAPLLLALVLSACMTSATISVNHASTPFPVMDTLAVLPIVMTDAVSGALGEFEVTLDTAVTRARLGLVTLPSPEVRTRLAKAGLTLGDLPVLDWNPRRRHVTRTLDTAAIRLIGQAVGARFLLRVQMAEYAVQESEDVPDDETANLLAEIWDADSVRIVWQASGAGEASRFGTANWSIGPMAREASMEAIRALGELLGGAPGRREVHTVR